MRLSDYKIKRNKINYIFISHLHGDHLYGLPGVISSFSLGSRKSTLYLYGPVGIKEYCETVFKLSQVHLTFPLVIQEIDTEVPLLLVEKTACYSVTAFPVFHRIPTYGFLFQEIQGDHKIKKEAIAKYDLSIAEIKNVKKGIAVTREGQEIDLAVCVHDLSKPRSYAYCADSKVDTRITRLIENADLLYFETTYMDEFADLAIERGHSTTKQAGRFAKSMNVGQLIIGHYSSRYKDVKPLLKETKEEFENVTLGYDGVVINL